MRVRWVAHLCVGIALWGQGCAASSAQGLVAEALRVPMAAAGPEGLDALLVTPGTPGRHPLVLISHGSPRAASDRPRMSPRGLIAQLNAFARRGFVAATVMRRGYGTSPGGWVESFGTCDHADHLAAGRAGAADLRAAIAALAQRSDVDPARILAVGQSAGGFATVALTAEPPPGLVAAISFAGGRGSRQADQVCSEEALIEAIRAFGSRSRLPMLWVYAENDHFFGPDLARRMAAAFREGGGTAQLVIAPAYGSDGHGLFSKGGETVWEPIVDAFLATKGLSKAVDPPVRSETPALEPPPQLGAGGRQDFEAYRAATSHKAFAVSPAGAYAWRTARTTRDEAVDAAMKRCEAVGGAPCRPYAIDDAYASR